MIKEIQLDVHLFEQVVHDNYSEIYFDYTIRSSLVVKSDDSEKPYICSHGTYDYCEHKFSITSDIRQVIEYNATLARELNVPCTVTVDYEVNPVESFDYEQRHKEIAKMFSDELEQFKSEKFDCTLNTNMTVWESSKRHDTIER